jgi:hypothetical protein
VGSNALISATTADFNTAVGGGSMLNGVVTGDNNTAIGACSMAANSTGDLNTAVGSNAQFTSTTASKTVSIGVYANYRITTGSRNTSVGYNAGSQLTNGVENTYIGHLAGDTSVSGFNNTAIGHEADVSAAGVDNEFTLGNGSIANLRCNDTSISSLSDLRDKTNIEDIPHGLDYILAMRPVKFDWNRRDGTAKGLKDYGFIAQELDQVEQDFGSAEYTRLVHKDNPEKWEADPMKTYPILIKAIQELTARVKELENE